MESLMRYDVPPLGGDTHRHGPVSTASQANHLIKKGEDSSGNLPDVGHKRNRHQYDTLWVPCQDQNGAADDGCHRGFLRDVLTPPEQFL